MSINESEYIIDNIKGMVKDFDMRHYENCVLPIPPKPVVCNGEIIQNTEGAVIYNFNLIIPDDVIINGVKLFEVSDVSIYNIWENDCSSDIIFYSKYLNKINNGELKEDRYISHTDIQNSNRSFQITKKFTIDELKKVLNSPNESCNFLVVLKSIDEIYSYNTISTRNLHYINKFYQIKIEFDGNNTLISAPNPYSMNFNAKPAKVIKSDRISRKHRYFSFDTIEIDEIYKNAFFIPKPCMINEFGEVVSYLDQNDYRKTIDNKPSNIENISIGDNNINYMMEWSNIYWAVTYINKPMKNNCYIFTICNSPVLDLKYDGIQIYLKPHSNGPNKFYTAIFPGIIYETKLRSVGVKVNNKVLSVNDTFNAFKSSAQKNKNNNNPTKPAKINFGIEDFNTRLFVNLATLMVFGDVSIVNKMFSSSVECNNTKISEVEKYMMNKNIDHYNFKLGLFKDNEPDSDNYINGYNVFGMALWNPCSISYYLDGIIYFEKKYSTREVESIFKITNISSCNNDTSDNLNYIDRSNVIYKNKLNDYTLVRCGIVKNLLGIRYNTKLNLDNINDGMVPILPFDGNISLSSLGSYCCLEASQNILETKSRMVYSRMYGSLTNIPTNRTFNLAKVGSIDENLNIIGKNKFTGARLTGTLI